MALSVRLSDELVKQAQSVSAVMYRSCAKQIEYWARIGKMAEENPELSYEFIRDTLIAKAESNNNDVSDYEFDN
ncbi:ParD-like family protein [Fastidiosibacter lacustris]|uniref:ParD-like family protein n=1 Tax=Fastidiosibacter lacustris TaxID=2056695 RepID=UPI000E35675C|nr:ParD-like family protein [Fastidiosibacter lacustris]